MLPCTSEQYIQACSIPARLRKAHVQMSCTLCCGLP